jgi:hypothetical protein
MINPLEINRELSSFADSFFYKQGRYNRRCKKDNVCQS